MAFALIVQWDTVRDAHEFAAAFLEYGEGRYGPPDVRTSAQASWSGPAGEVTFQRESNQTLWIQAPDAETAEVLRQMLSLPLRP